MGFWKVIIIVIIITIDLWCKQVNSLNIEKKKFQNFVFLLLTNLDLKQKKKKCFIFLLILTVLNL